MDFLNRTLQQARELFDSMTVGARIVTVLLVGVLVVSGAYLFRFQATGGDTYLLGGRVFTQSQLADMEAALAEAQITDYSIEGNRLKVARSERDEALAAIARAGALPMSAGDLDDPNRTPNPFLTKTQEERLAMAEKKQKFGRMMEQVETLEYATLEYDEQRQGGLDRRLTRSATVMAKGRGTRPLEDRDVQAIVRAVEGVLTGINPTDIIVVDANTGESHRGRAGDDLNDPRNNAYAQTKQYYENDWRRKITEALRSFGMPNVQVNVELDETISQVEESRQLTNPVVVESETEKETNESTRADTAGRPGVAANTGAANSSASVAAGTTSDNSTQSRESSRSRIGGTISSTQKASLVPKRVSVSIGIPEAYYQALWLKRNPVAVGETPKPMTAADLATLEAQTRTEIERKVQPLIINPLTGQNIFEPIVVTTDYEIPTEPLPAPSTSDLVLVWLQENWKTLGMFGLGAFGLLIMRGMLRGAESSAAERQAASDEAREAGTGESADGGEGEDRSKRRFDGDGPSLRDELTELIQDDPDAAVSVLKQWIGEAA